MRPRVSVLVVALLTLVAATAAAQPKPTPADVIAIATLPPQGLDGIAAFADRVQPGAGGAVRAGLTPGLANLAEADNLAGVATGKSVRVVLVDPPGGEIRAALLVPVQDAKALAKAVGSRGAKVKPGKGWAVIGPAPTVDRIAPWALGTLALEPAPPLPTVTVFPAAIFAAHRTAIEAQLAQISSLTALGPGGSTEIAAMMTSMSEGLLGAFEASARLDVVIDASADRLAVDFAATPRPGTTLAQFVATQKPSRFGLLERLPVESTVMVSAGHLEAGPYRAALLAMTEPLIAKAFGGKIDAGQRATIQAMMDAMTGEVGFVMEPGRGLAMSALYGITDAKKVSKQIDTLLRAFGTAPKAIELGGVKMRTTLGRDAKPHDGVRFSVGTTTYDYRGLPKDVAAQQRALQGDRNEVRWAAWDDVLGYVSGQSPAASARRLVDVSRGKARRAPMPPPVAAIFDEARRRGDSLVWVMDLAGIAAVTTGKPGPSTIQHPIAMSFGFADGRAHLRLSVTSSAVQALAQSAIP